MSNVLPFPKWEPIDRDRVTEHYSQTWNVVYHTAAVGMWANWLVYKLMHEMLQMMMEANDGR